MARVPSASPAAPRAPGPSLSSILGVMAFDGFGARFQSVLLAVHATDVGGLEGFSGFTAAALLGTIAAGVLTGPLSGRISGRGILAFATVALLGTRLLQYAFVASFSALGPILVSQFVASLLGVSMINASKAQVPADPGDLVRSASRSLAWMNVVNGVGGVFAAAAAAAVAAFAPTAVLVAVGAVVAVISGLPPLRLARRTTVGAGPHRVRWSTYRRIAPAALLGAAIGLFASGLPVMRDGLVLNVYDESWLAPAACAVVAGNLVAASLIRKVASLSRGPRHDLHVWPLFAAFGLLGWVFADSGPAGMLGALCLSGFAGQSLGALLEARILEAAGPERAVAALTATGAMGSGASALAVIAVPGLLASLGFAGVTAWSVATLTLFALASAAHLHVSRRPLDDGFLPPTEDVEPS